LELERLIQSEYPTYLERKDLSIKISGCMNSCGQHMAASIGFHGSSIKKMTRIIPAMQVVLGGGVNPDGVGYLANKIIKLPTRRVPEVVRLLLADFEEHQVIEETYPSYVLRQGNKYFYQLLKHLASIDSLKDSDLIDWGQDDEYKQAIGVGECAGISYDVVSTILHDAKQKVEDAKLTFLQNDLADSIYHSYSAFVIAAKALLLGEDIKCNRHIRILSDFQNHFVETKIIQFDGPDFESIVLEINKKEPTASFAESYFNVAEKFVKWADNYRQQTAVGTKAVIESHYLA
jgi:sulfite reductase (ferredoxin)